MEISYFLSSPAGSIFAFIWGAIWGSFANVVIYRMPKGESVVWPGSHCTSCNHELGAKDNIPILSYFIRRGKCGYCGAGFSIRYALVELLLALLSLFVFIKSPLSGGEISLVNLAGFLLDFSFIFLLLVLSFIDWDTFILPDILIFPFGLIYLISLPLIKPITYKESIIGGLLGFFLFFLTSLFYKIIKGKEGLGMGDAKLLGLLGLYVGPLGITPIILFASFQGILFAGIASIFKIRWSEPKVYKGITDDDEEFEQFINESKDNKWSMKPIPFGPFLSLGGIQVFFWGDHFYRIFFGL
jgi:leader peptidase (prepilin peptidase) / N-methyltransferase